MVLAYTEGLAWGQVEQIDRDLSKYPHRLQFYTLPPTDDISLEDFETMAVDRLKGCRGSLSIYSSSQGSRDR